jgi:hypothetical protein
VSAIKIRLREPPEAIDDLDELLSDLREADLSVEYEHDPYKGYAVTWGQLFDFVIDESARHALDAIEAVFVAWVWRRLRRDREEGLRGRPRFLTIWGPDGSMLKKIKVSEPDESEDITVEERELARRFEEAKRRAGDSASDDPSPC